MENDTILYTGLLEKRNPVNGGFHSRFLLLTTKSVHWFKKTDGSDLFGAERGHAALDSVLTVRVLDEDSTCFELQTLGHMKRVFRANTPQLCEEWVSAIRSAIKGLDNVYNQYDSGSEVVVNLVSLSSNGAELVISRYPTWGRVINVPAMKKGDQLVLSTSNGGMVSFSYDFLLLKAEDGLDFDAPVQSVTLASSLKLSVRDCAYASGPASPAAAGSSASSASSATSSSKAPAAVKYVKQTVGRLVKQVVSTTKDRSNSVTLVLSAMVLLVGAASVPHLSPDTSLLFMFSTLLAVYSIQRLLLSSGGASLSSSSSSSQGGEMLALILHSHAFTSPDAPLNRPEDEIPQRFIDGMGGDLKEARRRWDITRHWREAERVDQILTEKQPYYFLIKKHYPFYHCGRGRKGHLVFFERPGDLETPQLVARGVTVQDMIRHWIFVTEYQWNIMLEGDETAKSISVIDVGNVKMGDLAGDNFTFVSTTIGYANAHYPERSYVIYIVNAPVWFSMLWKMIKPMVHPNTQKKVKILSRSETLKGLEEHIAIEDIPEYYGGKRDYGGHDSCRWQSPEVVALGEFVKRINEGDQAGGAAATSAAAGTDSTTNAPPGNPGGNGSSMDAVGSKINGGGGGKGAPSNGKATPAPSTPRSMTSTGSVKMFAPISPLTSEGGAGDDAPKNGKKKNGWLLGRK